MYVGNENSMLLPIHFKTISKPRNYEELFMSNLDNLVTARVFQIIMFPL